MKHVYLASLGLCLLAVPAQAAENPLSSILTKARYNELCVETADGRQIVDPGRLAHALIAEAGVPFDFQDRANSEHKPDNAATIDEIVYLLENSKAILPTSKLAEQVIVHVSESRSALRQYLRGKSSVGDTSIYKRDPDDAENADLPHFFGKPAQVVIACTPPSTKNDRSAMVDFRLRGKVEDLRDKAVTPAVLKKTSAATVSFESNDVSETETYDVNLATGLYFDLTPEVGQYNLGLLPFVQYERRETSGDADRSGDKDKLGLGVLADLFLFGSEPFDPTLTVGFYPKYLSDFELNSEVLSGTAFAVPDVSIPLQGNYVFQTNIYNTVGPYLLVKPGVKLVATADYVLDEGQNPDFAGHDDFYGLGGEAALAFAFDENVSVLSQLSFTFSYRWLSLFSTSKDDLHRFEAAMAYDIFGSGNTVVELSYVDGEDMDTQQREEFWRLALGLKL